MGGQAGIGASTDVPATAMAQRLERLGVAGGIRRAPKATCTKQVGVPLSADRTALARGKQWCHTDGDDGWQPCVEVFNGS